MPDRRTLFEAQALPHLDAAYNLARWLARSPADADDIVQEAMMRAFRAFDGVRGETVKPWLMAIVRNAFYDHAARAARTRPLADEDAARLVWDEPDPEEQAHWTGARRKLDRVLAGLPAEFREVLVLREMEDLSYRQIAVVIAAPIGTVMSRLARARALTRERLGNADDLR